MQFAVEVRMSPMFDRASDVVRDEMQAAASWGLQEIRSEIIPRTPANFNVLRNGNQIELHGESVDLLGRVYNNTPYGIPVELGTNPHPVSRAGRESLVLWVRRKLGVSDEKEVRSVAFLIARAISRRGSKAWHMYRDGVAAAKGRVQARFAEVPGRIIRRLQGGA